MKHLVTLMVAVLLGALPLAGQTRRALIFGLGRQMDARWGKINGDRDVVWMEEMLRGVGYTDVRTLVNEQATKAAMVGAMKELAVRCRRGDVVFVHYSGHGQLMTDLDGDEAERMDGRHAQWDESWIPYDAYMTYCAEDRGEKHLCDDELAVLLMAIRKKIGNTGKLTVAIDACHSGDATMGEDDECVRGVDVKFNIPRSLTPANKPSAKSKKTPAPSGRAVEGLEPWQTISACRPYQLCTEMKGERVGKLTYALCELKGRAFKMSNRQLEATLGEFMERHKGRLPQNPMVSGKR